MLSPTRKEMENGQYKYRISVDNIFSPDIFGKSYLYQVGRAHLKPAAVVPEHIQLNYFELTAVTEGRGTVSVNGESVPVEKGDIHIAFAGDIHSIYSDEKMPLKYDFIAIQTADDALFGEMEKIVAAHHEASARLFRDDAIGGLVARAISETQEKRENWRIVTEAVINEIFVFTARALESETEVGIKNAVNESRELCFGIMNYIDNHIYTMKKLTELTKITNYSYNYLSNLFKDVTGETLNTYYRNRKLESARLLLEEGFSVTYVANVLGYSSAYPFSLAFKNHYGYPPSNVKKRLS